MTEATVETVAAPVVEKADRLSTTDFIKAYKEAAAEKLTIDGFSDKIGVKKGSATVRLSNIRKDLEKGGLTKDQVNSYLPSLTRAPRKTTSERNQTLNDIVASLVAETVNA